MKLSAITNAMQFAADYHNAIASFTKRPLTEEADYPSENSIDRALRALSKLSQDYNIPIAIIGGAATIHHGYKRFTKDIDLVISTKDYANLVRVIHEYGFIMLKHSNYMFEMLFPDEQGAQYDLPNGKSVRGVFLEVMKAGMNDTTEPYQMGVTKGVGFADLNSYIAMKLKAGRIQDQADIVHVLMAQNDKIQQVTDYIEWEYSELADDLQRLIRQIEKESRNPRTGY